jgi:branched-chain amino acid transport system ATP-binding protein
MLSIRELRTGYGRIEVLHGIDLSVDDGEIVTIIGANGAGKSTLLKAISGMLGVWHGEVEFEGESLHHVSVEAIAGRGLVQIPEGRQLFGPLTSQRAPASERRDTLRR